jgi:hypothetical protein
VGMTGIEFHHPFQRHHICPGLRTNHLLLLCLSINSVPDTHASWDVQPPPGDADSTSTLRHVMCHVFVLRGGVLRLRLRYVIMCLFCVARLSPLCGRT